MEPVPAGPEERGARTASTSGIRWAGRLRRRVLGIGEREASFERRGFPGARSPQRARLEEIGRVFIRGYDGALESEGSDDLAARLALESLEMRGFAYEGAAMGLGLLDLLRPWRAPRLRAFLDGPAHAHVFMGHVGAGWALARVPWGRERAVQRLDPLFVPLAFDGYGFHEGYFHWRRCLERGERPRGLTGYRQRAFDQGLGRALWFVEGADVTAVAARLERLEPARHADLWSGVGLAAAYAGGASAPELARLLEAAGEHAPWLAQGAAFAAAARRRARNPAAHTEAACGELCACSAAEAAAACDAARAALRAEPGERAYEEWRAGVRERLAAVRCSR